MFGNRLGMWMLLTFGLLIGLIFGVASPVQAGSYADLEVYAYPSIVSGNSSSPGQWEDNTPKVYMEAIVDVTYGTGFGALTFHATIDEHGVLNQSGNWPTGFEIFGSAQWSGSGPEGCEDVDFDSGCQGMIVYWISAPNQESGKDIDKIVFRAINTSFNADAFDYGDCGGEIRAFLSAPTATVSISPDDFIQVCYNILFQQ